jgi:hypothetical protein
MALSGFAGGIFPSADSGRGLFEIVVSAKDAVSFLGLPLGFLTFGVGLAEMSCTLAKMSVWVISRVLLMRTEVSALGPEIACLSSQHRSNTSIIFSRFLIGLKPYAASWEDSWPVVKPLNEGLLRSGSGRDLGATGSTSLLSMTELEILLSAAAVCRPRT